MGLFDSLFSKTDATPKLDTVNYTAAANQGLDYNQGALQRFQSTAPANVDFMSKLFNQYSGNAKQADSTVYNLGNQLATKGQTDLMGDFFQYSRRQGLENAAATGAPISGSFGQSLGSSLGVQNILQNQLTGANLLGNYSQQQGQRFQSFLQPSLGALNASFVNPQAFMSGAQQNTDISNQNKYIDFANSQRSSWFDTLLSDTAKSAVGMPFSFTQNASNVAASSPQIAAGMFTSYFGGSGAGIPAAKNAGAI